MNDIPALKAAVEKLHACQATHASTAHVYERFQGKVVWDGAVEVFTLSGSAPAKRCYAWHHADGPGDSKTRIVTVLELPPVDSAQTAVRAAIVSEFKQICSRVAPTTRDFLD